MLVPDQDKETTKPPGLEESESSPALTESNKKRVMLGSIIGGGIFLSLLIAIIVLVATSDTHYNPQPKPPPKPIRDVDNPFIVVYEDIHEKHMDITLYNNRTKMVNGTTSHIPGAINIKNTTENEEPEDIKVIFTQMDEHLLNVKYYDMRYPRWEVPILAQDEDPYAKITRQIRSPLGVTVLRHPNNTFEWSLLGKTVDLLPVITTKDCRLQYFDKYLEFEARVQTDHLYGMGERPRSFLLKEGNYSLWNRDYAYEFNNKPDADTEIGTYGSHPFFLNRLKDKKDFIGVFMRNSNAMLFSFWSKLNEGAFINYKMIGGIIDLYVFHEADPDYILKKYHALIGRPYLPPEWAVGFQQARRGYTLDKMKEIVTKHQEYRLPIDAIWADIELNDNYKAFTVDQGKFGGLKDFVRKMHDPHEGIDMRFVAIANPGLKKEVGYKYYDEAVKKNCLIYSAAVHDTPYEGRTIAGATVWLDFMLHDALLVWAEGLHDLKELSELDGVWISENEISNLCDGECRKRESEAEEQRVPKIPNPFHNTSEFDYLQYRPTLDPLERTTLPMTAYHYGDPMFYKQYYTHNLFGLQVTKATYEALYGIFEDKRFLVVSRSTWPGSGHYGSHWLGENYATWESLMGSIPGILNFNMFGIPHVGAAIGGFYGNTDDELLARWYELGCYYPLMLSYTSAQANQKEIYANEKIMPYIKNALMERYGLLRFMYTQIFEAFAWGGPVVHPLFFDFPDDEETFKDTIVDRTFMWAQTLYVIPALIKGLTRTRAYLPNWRWYDLRTLEMVTDYKVGHVGDYHIFEQPLGYITVLIKGGSIFPYQLAARDAKVMNVEDLKKIPALIVVAPDHTGRATGTMVVDADGIRPHPDPMSHTYRHYAFTYMNNIFRINKLAGFDFHEEHEYDYFWELIILDVFGQHTIDFVCMMDTDLRKKELEWWHALSSSALIIHDTRMAKMPMFKLESIVWGTKEQHDFCRFQVHAERIQYPEDGKTIIAELVTSDPLSYQIRLDLKAMLLADKIISLQIIKNEMGKYPWIVPDVVDDNIRKTSRASIGIRDSGFKMSGIGEPFHFELADPLDSHDFFLTTRNLPFIYVQNFIHMKFMISGRHIFGLGERVGKFELGDGTYSLFNYDQFTEETGIPPGNNMYGSHPFYLMHLHNPNEFAGFFLLNSNPMDVRIKHVGMHTQIDHVLVGGIIDAFFLQEGTVEEVIKNYQYLIGRPEPLPYWAFGYHQSRWGYRDIEHLKDVVRKFADNRIPLDAVWMDKDYMDNYRVFTVDNKKWYGIKQFIDTQLHAKGIHFVAIVDPSIAKDEHYPVYMDGLERGVYLQSSFTKQPLIGVTWPGFSVWIDFLHPTAEKFWEDQLRAFHDMVPFDGLWLDMNEPSNFCDGECPDELHYIYYHFPLDFYDDLYYNPTHRGIERGTVSMEAQHYGGTVDRPEFNYHNLYGLMQSRATFRFMAAVLRKRPFIISSSTFPGSGRWASHWLGDNYSSWHMMEYSLAGVFNFGLYGIPFVGADICGFDGNATVNLCSRWMQLGAFYPFMRNHNSPKGNPQEPYVDAKLASISRKAIRTRYSLARYLYSHYMHAVLDGGLVFKPVLFEFPTDMNLYKYMDESFMFGYAIRMTPVLADGVVSLTSYFPNSHWYEFPSFKQVLRYNQSSTVGHNLTMQCSLESEVINLHIKGGSIFTYQDQAMGENIMNITEMQRFPVKLIVVPDHRQMASGYVIYDNDEEISMFNQQFHDYHLSLFRNELKFIFEHGTKTYQYNKEDNIITQVIILGGTEYQPTQCAKLYDNVDHSWKHMKVKHEGERITLDPPDSYKMKFQQIDSISWYNTTDC